MTRQTLIPITKLPNLIGLESNGNSVVKIHNIIKEKINLIG